MEIKDINTLEDIQSKRMYLLLQELKILLRDAKDQITGEVLLDSTLEKQGMNILKSLLVDPKRFIDACLVLSSELGAKKTAVILNDRGDYDDNVSILEKFTVNHAEIFCNCLALTNK
jgi:hypothetical protein